MKRMSGLSLLTVMALAACGVDQPPEASTGSDVTHGQPRIKVAPGGSARPFCYVSLGGWCTLTNAGADAYNSYYGLSGPDAAVCGEVVGGEIYLGDQTLQCNDDEYVNGACQCSDS